MMKQIRELLVLIEGGNAVDILSESDLIERFNYLLEHRLIVVEDHKIYLTEKGQQVKAGSLDLKRQEKKNGISLKGSELGRNKDRHQILYISFATVLFFALLLYWLI